MANLFERWKQFRDQKNNAAQELDATLFDPVLSPEDAAWEARLTQQYNDLYAQMYKLQELFTAEDWAAYEADQVDIRESERQGWLIENRYGHPNPSGGIADWWHA